MSDPESVAKWLQIRDNSLSLHRLGENPGQILRWSADKSVQEVSNRCVTRVSRRSVTGASYVQEVSNRCVTRVSRRSVTGALQECPGGQ